MPDPSKLLLLDIYHLALLMLGLGLISYALIRRGNPLIRWHEHGNVWTEPFMKIDLLIMAVIVGSYYMAIRHVAVSDPVETPTLDSASIFKILMVQFLSMSVLIGGIIFVLSYVRRVDIAELFGLTRLSVSKIILWAVAALGIAFPLVIGVAIGWGTVLENAFGTKPEQQEIVSVMRESTSLQVRLLIAFSACVFAPITEEILFRGYFYPTVKRYSERFFAAIIVSLLFALIHSNTMSVLPLFVLAMSFTIAYELTGCLLVPIAMHAMFNFTQIVFMIAPNSNG